jgi:hypothetical protein
MDKCALNALLDSSLLLIVRGENSVGNQGVIDPNQERCGYILLRITGKLPPTGLRKVLVGFDTKSQRHKLRAPDRSGEVAIARLRLTISQ